MPNNDTSRFFHRQFPLKSFRKFLGEDILAKLSKQLGPRRRKRLLGLEGFLWLGLFVAAHAACANLREIFHLAATVHSNLLNASLVSVPGFCQYRAFFPSEASGQPLALSGSQSLSKPSFRKSSLAWTEGLGLRYHGSRSSGSSLAQVWRSSRMPRGWTRSMSSRGAL